MLTRREFIKLSGYMAAGAVLPLSMIDKVGAVELPTQQTTNAPVNLRLHGHRKSGCSFHPELTDWWAGGGLQVPDWL